MSEEERNKLKTLSASIGLSDSNWVRMTVAKAYEELTPSQKRRFKK